MMRNKMLNEQQAMDRLRNGERATWISMAAGYAFPDGSAAPVKVMRRIARNGNARLDGRSYVYTTPEELREMSDRRKAEDDAHRDRIVGEWTDRIIACDDDRGKLASVILDLARTAESGCMFD